MKVLFKGYMAYLPHPLQGQYPSDSGQPVDDECMYKVHFRVYATVIYNQQTVFANSSSPAYLK